MKKRHLRKRQKLFVIVTLISFLAFIIGIFVSPLVRVKEATPEALQQKIYKKALDYAEAMIEKGFTIQPYREFPDISFYAVTNNMNLFLLYAEVANTTIYLTYRGTEILMPIFWFHEAKQNIVIAFVPQM